MSCIDVTVPPAPTNLPVINVAAAALYDADGRVLLAEHIKPDWAGYWEFPGGRIEDGETPEAALVRELKEELDVTTSTSCLSPIGFVSYAYPKFHLVMLLFAIRQWSGPNGSAQVMPTEGQRVQWAFPLAMRDIKLLPADIPLIPVL